MRLFEHREGERSMWWYVAAWCVCVCIVCAAPFMGGFGETSDWVFWRMRVPRVAAAFLAGGGLSLCGMCYQGLFRNVLATPYTLGVSGGASLGVALAVRLNVAMGGVGGIGATSVFAFLGAMGAMGLVSLLCRARKTGSSNVLLLAGVATSFFFSSLIMLLQYVGTPGEVNQIMRWLMGGLDVYGYGELGVLAGVCVAGGAVVCLKLDELNLLAVGDDYAGSRGVSVRLTKVVLHVAVSLIVGGIVALCGPIGFVGMVSPHISRLLVGGNHRRLAPTSLVFGGTFLVLCDTVGRTVLAPAELPVGIVTALLGGPFFLWLLLRGRD